MAQSTAPSAADPSSSRLHRAPGLEHRLHVAENPGPASRALLRELIRHHAGHDRRALELVDHGEPREAGCDPLDLPRDAGEALGFHVFAEEEAIGLHELSQRVGLLDGAIWSHVKRREAMELGEPGVRVGETIAALD